MRCSHCNEEYDGGAGAHSALCERCRGGDAGHGDDFKACPACAEPIRARAVLCRFCGHDVRLPAPEPGASRTSRAHPRDARLRPGALPLVKSPALAACLSFLCGGLGQLYCGRIGRGLAIMVGPALFVILVLVGGLTPGTLVLLYVGVSIFYVWQVFDAYQCAKQSNEGLMRKTRPRKTTSRTRRRRGRRRATAR